MPGTFSTAGQAQFPSHDRRVGQRAALSATIAPARRNSGSHDGSVVCATQHLAGMERVARAGDQPGGAAGLPALAGHPLS